LPGEPEDLSRRLNDVGFNFVKMVREMMDHAVEIGAEMLRKTEEACADADLIIHTFAHVVGAHTLAREKNIPDIHIQTFPMFTPTGDYPNVTMPDLKLRVLNRLTHIVSKKLPGGRHHLDLNKSVPGRDFPNVSFIFQLTKIRYVLRPRSCVLGAQAFSHLQEIGEKMSMLLVIISSMLTSLISPQLICKIFWMRGNLQYVSRSAVCLIVMQPG
jgi:hypothetical protein